MKHLLTIVALLFVAAGCDSEMGNGQDVPDGGAPTLGPGRGSDAGVAKSDTMPSLQDAKPGYTANGVFVNFGSNPCGISNGTTQCQGWDTTSGKCYASTTVSACPTSGICAVAPACGTYAPGTLLIWSSTDPRFHYLDDPSGGNICLPNTTPYVVPC